MKRSRYPPFKTGDLVQLKKRYAKVNYYGIIMQMGDEANWELDERFVRVLWTIDKGTRLREERIRHLTLIKAS